MMPLRRIRVLIVDDSPFVRKVIREVLSKSADIEIVGVARDGLDALEQCVALHPDVLTLDLMMPELDGLSVMRSLAENPSAPRVVLVTSSALDSRIAVEALQLGAVALVQKPTALATTRLYELESELVRQIRIAASSLVLPESSSPTDLPKPIRRQPNSRASIIVVGTSTGGPHALTRLFTALPADLRVPLAAVVHIPIGYTEALAERIDRVSALAVMEAKDGMDIGPGMAVVARAGLHLRLQRVGPTVARCWLDPEPIEALHRPSVDVLFASASEAFGDGVLGVVLTGMGKDGLEGARTIHENGGVVLTEHASSCVVDGMPRAVLEAGMSDGEARIERMAEALLARL